MPVTSYSRTPANNNGAPPNGAPENWAPSQVNDTFRQVMTDIVNEGAKNQTKVLGSVAGTNTVTGAMSPSLDAYAAGMIVVFTPANTNTGAATLNIDSLGALDIQKSSASALIAGDLVVGVPAVLVLDSGADDWILLNPMTLLTGGVEAGYRGMPRRNFSASDSTAASDNGRAVIYTGTGGHTFTVDSDFGTQGNIMRVYNQGSASLTIAESLSGDMVWFNGSGSLTSTGSRTLAVGGAATIWMPDANNAFIEGTGLS
jgi:hypothetical protein